MLSELPTFLSSFIPNNAIYIIDAKPPPEGAGSLQDLLKAFRIIWPTFKGI
jgi:hypothetical protein